MAKVASAIAPAQSQPLQQQQAPQQQQLDSAPIKAKGDVLQSVMGKGMTGRRRKSAENERQEGQLRDVVPSCENAASVYRLCSKTVQRHSRYIRPRRNVKLQRDKTYQNIFLHYARVFKFSTTSATHSEESLSLTSVKSSITTTFAPSPPR
jgi:hypothetical protein